MHPGWLDSADLAKAAAWQAPRGLNDAHRAPNVREDPEGIPGSEAGRHAVRGGSKESAFAGTRSAAVQWLARDAQRDDVGFRFILRPA